jgi:predicted permease
MLNDFFMRVRAIFRRESVEREMDDELRFHYDAAVAKHVAAGRSHEDALRLARLEFGATENVREEMRDVRGTAWLETLAQDLRYGMRMLRKSPGYAAIAILTLAMGIGANAAIFSFVNAWMIKPIPYPNGRQLMVLQAHDVKKDLTWNNVTSSADFFDYVRENKSFQAVVPWSNQFYNLTGDGRPDRVAGGLVGWNFFQTLGAQPMMGRLFEEQEGQPSSSHVAIISRGLWETRYAADPKIIGRRITLEGETYEVVGVLPTSFQFPLLGTSNVWTPLAVDDKGRNNRKSAWFAAFGRLKPGVTEEQASAEAKAFSARMAKLYPETDTNAQTLLSSMTYEIGKNEGTPQLMVCFWVVGLVLLIACANVANLMLARASARMKEFAVRGALGASRMRLIRQLLTESAVLFIAGGAWGAAFAWWILHTIETGYPDRIRGYLLNYGRVELDVTALVYTFVIALVCGVIFGLAPAFQSSGVDVNRALKEASGQMSGSRRVAKTRRIFVGAQIALAVVVLIVTALLTESFGHMIYDEMGFRPANVMTAELVLPKTKYASDAQIRGFYEQAMERVAALPGVTVASAGEYIPFGDSGQSFTIHVAGRQAELPGETIGAEYSAVTPGYFAAMQIPLLRGRGILASDGPDAPKVVVIDETLVQQQFPNEDPIGHQLEFDTEKGPFTIVGVVHDVKRHSMNERAERQMYVPSAQAPSADMNVVVRTTGPDSAMGAGLGAAIQKAIWSVDSEQPVSQVRAVDDLIYEENTGYRVLTALIGFVGVLALLLGGIGIYGVMSSAVQARLHEIGIRMALGATPGAMIRMMVRYGLAIALVGIGCGLIGAAAASQGMGAILYKVKAIDPVTFSAVAAIFLLVALAACYIPARRGAKVDPVTALRCE